LASKDRDEIAKRMTPAQVAQAQADATNWRPASNPVPGQSPLSLPH
jgi:hypothetical protein